MSSTQWTRRQFLALWGSAAAAAAFPLGAFADGSPDTSPETGPLLPVSRRAAELYRQAFVLDANTLASIGYMNERRDMADALAAIRNSGLSALKSTIGGSGASFEDTVAELAATQSLIDRYPKLFLKVARPEDLERARDTHRVALILSFEAATMLDGRIERIDLFRQFDVLVMQLSYNHRTVFGGGCLDGDDDGLTALGREAVARMNATGVALDLSHANARTTAEGIAACKGPAIISHAGCRAVYDHPRNKTDRDLRSLADKGGVMGVYMLPFLTADDRQPELSDYMRHMVHALNVCGEDHVGIGTDSMFFTVTARDLDAIRQAEISRRKAGLAAPGENRPPYIPDANTPRKLEYVTDALLKHGYGPRVVEKILGLNFRRVFSEVWKPLTA
jgi:membrane dipeptidase